MLGFDFSFKWLYFTRPSGPPPPPPEGLEREWLQTRSGRLELLTAVPSSTESKSPPILFCHGGMGGAWVWAEYMRYLSSKGVPCYAISLRGHGQSWHPTFLGMVYGTFMSDLASDLVAAIDYVTDKHGEVVLVGHSSGGGLGQDVLARGAAHARALALLGAIPAFGSMSVYKNWAAIDPWFSFRMFFHLWHPVSPLSTPELTRRAFFSDSFKAADVLPFQRQMARYESFWWPLAMMRGFARAQDVLKSLTARSVLVMAGTQDKLMTPEITQETAAFYATQEKASVRLEFVTGAGHQLQNDVQWQDGADKLLEWYRLVT